MILSLHNNCNLFPFSVLVKGDLISNLLKLTRAHTFFGSTEAGEVVDGILLGPGIGKMSTLCCCSEGFDISDVLLVNKLTEEASALGGLLTIAAECLGMMAPEFLWLNGVAVCELKIADFNVDILLSIV